MLITHIQLYQKYPFFKKLLSVALHKLPLVVLLRHKATIGRLNMNTTPHISINLDIAASLGLTERQAESAAWAAEGKVDEEIGIIIGRTARTAKSHIINAMQRTETHTRAQLVAMMFINGVFTAKHIITVLALCVALFTNAAANNNDDMARRMRNRRNREYAVIEEGNIMPELAGDNPHHCKGLTA